MSYWYSEKSQIIMNQKRGTLKITWGLPVSALQGHLSTGGRDQQLWEETQ